MSFAEELIDFHSHILPNVDHGSDGLETTEFQLASAKKHGIGKIISTSHFYPTAHSVEGFVKKRNAAFEYLRNNLTDIPEIRLGAEVLLCDGIDRLPCLDSLFINGTDTLLLELPFSGFGDNYYRTVKRLSMSGINVVLAHADRYDPGIIDSLLPIGVKLQINASSLVGFNRVKKKYLLRWFEDQYVVALGSDIHGKDDRAYGRLIKAFRSIDLHRDFILAESSKIWNNSLEFTGNV